MAEDLHPFERRGLGSAPFRFVGLRREQGNCAYCGRLIAWSCRVADADGREAVVGTDCVQRTCEGSRLSADIERELKHRKKLEAAERHEARRAICLAALRADPGFLADRPHPAAWRTDKTLRDEVLLLFRTQAGCAKAFRIIETALARSGATPSTQAAEAKSPAVPRSRPATAHRPYPSADPARSGGRADPEAPPDLAHFPGRPTGGIHSPRRRAVQA